MIFKPLKKKKKFGLNQTSTPSQSPTVKLILFSSYFINCVIYIVIHSYTFLTSSLVSGYEDLALNQEARVQIPVKAK